MSADESECDRVPRSREVAIQPETAHPANASKKIGAARFTSLLPKRFSMLSTDIQPHKRAWQNHSWRCRRNKCSADDYRYVCHNSCQQKSCAAKQGKSRRNRALKAEYTEKFDSLDLFK